MSDGNQPQESEVIRNLRKTNESQAEQLKTLLEKDRKRSLTDLKIPAESQDTLVKKVLSDQPEEIWADTNKLAEAIKSQGLGHLIPIADTAEPTSQPTPGYTPAEQRMDFLAGASTPPPAPGETSPLQNANAAFAKGELRQGFAAAAQWHHDNPAK